MTTQRDGTNAPAGEDQPTTNRSDEQRRATGAGERGLCRRQELALVRTYIARELPPSQVPLPRTGSARRGALHLLQGGGRGGERRGYLQPGGHRRRPLRKSSHLPAERRGGSSPTRRLRAPPRPSPPCFRHSLTPLEELLIDNGVEISAEPIQEGGGLWQTLLFAFGPALLLIGGYIWLYRRAQQQGGGMGGALTSVGRSRARRYDKEQDTKVTFDDVAGIEEAENELVEIVDFLMDPEKYTAGERPPKACSGGSPGNGQDALGAGRRGRGWCAVLLLERLSSSSCSWGSALVALATSSRRPRECPSDHLHRRARLHRTVPRSAVVGDLASRSRPSTRSSPRWMVSPARRA